MRLFAIIANADENPETGRLVVESFLKHQLSKEQVKEYLQVYDDYLKSQNDGAEGEKKKRRLAVSSVKVIVICNQINEELTQKQKFVVLLNLIEFVSANNSISEQEMEFITTVSSSFNIPDEEFTQCLLFASKENITEIDDSSNLLVIRKKQSDKHDSKYMRSDSLQSEIGVLRVASVGMYLIRYYGNTELFLNGQLLVPNRIFILSQGSSIRSHKV